MKNSLEKFYKKKKEEFQNDIIEIAIDQCGSANDRKLAFIDKCLDCFLVAIKTYGVYQKIAKIGKLY